jgi:hypothetical protein
MNDALGFEDEPPVVARNVTSLALLQAIYRSPDQPLHVRMKAATAALPYEFPKLAVTAIVQEGGDIAERLEQARLRTQGLFERRVAEAVEARLRARTIEAPYTRETPVPSGRTPTRIGAPFAGLRRI